MVYGGSVPTSCVRVFYYFYDFYGFYGFYDDELTFLGAAILSDFGGGLRFFLLTTL